MEVDWIILADAAEVVNNKLYILGGGWDALTVNSALPIVHRTGIAAAFAVPWNETNQQHEIALEVQDQDGQVLAGIGGQMEVGRPPGIPLGSAQRIQLALNADLTIKRLGTHVVVAKVAGQELRRVRFAVVAGPGYREADPAPTP